VVDLAAPAQHVGVALDVVFALLLVLAALSAVLVWPLVAPGLIQLTLELFEFAFVCFVLALFCDCFF